MRFVSTLRRTLSLHFLPVAVIPTLAFGLVAITLLNQHLQSGTYERNRLLARDIATATLWLPLPADLSPTS